MVVVPGVTVTGVPVNEPGVQEKVVPVILLLADKEEVAPLHMVVGFAVGVIAGFGLTVMVSVVVMAHWPVFGVKV